MYTASKAQPVAASRRSLWGTNFPGRLFPSARQCQKQSGLGVNLNGAYAEYVKIAQKMVFPLPAELSWEQGALVEPLAVGMHAINLMPLQLLDTVVILGAGTIGLTALLAARMKGGC
jgi:threonine dehydrogenase-like Zn-dependent dehydrogenase